MTTAETLRFVLLHLDEQGLLYDPEWIPILERVRATSRSMRETVDFELDTVLHFDWHQMWNVDYLPARLNLGPLISDWRGAVALYRLLRSLNVTIEWEQGIIQHFNMWSLFVNIVHKRIIGSHRVVSRMHCAIRACELVLMSENGRCSYLIDLISCEDYVSCHGVTRMNFYDIIDFEVLYLLLKLSSLEQISHKV